VAVVAGTAPDASRVAYVKTVRPEAGAGDYMLDEAEDGGTWRRDPRDQYMNLEQPSPEVSPLNNMFVGLHKIDKQRGNWHIYCPECFHAFSELLSCSLTALKV
jgi:hypothetical protein